MPPPSPPRPPWRLKPLHLPDLPALLTPDGPLTIGRAASNDVVIADAKFPQVSTHHVRIEARAGVLTVEDLGSTNGTLVNGRPVTRCELSSGDTIQLGKKGPRFVALKTSELAPITGGAGLGATKVMRSPMPRGDGLLARRVALTGDAVPRDFKRTVAVAATFFLIVLIGGGAGFVHLKQRGEEERARLAGVSAQIQRKLERRLREANDRLDRQATFWDDQRSNLEAERDGLLDQLADLERGDEDSSRDVEEIRRQLVETQQYLEMFDPVGIEQKQLAEVSRVRGSVVLIEKRVVYRDKASGSLLHFEQDARRDEPLNLDGRGSPLSLDASTGSGFCVSADGWVITNAHVLEFSERNFPINLADDVDLAPERQLEVVFTDSSDRHPAKVVKVVQRKGIDLALLRIEPFEGMAWIEDLDLERGVPEPGSEVYLFGFPLGHHALQAGDRVIASTFKGILSRFVDPFLQVDAGVYPGNSGGPLTDAQGRVIGVIFSVQNNLDGTTAANIGYAIPIEKLSHVWPPPVETASADAPPGPVPGASSPETTSPATTSPATTSSAATAAPAPGSTSG